MLSNHLGKNQDSVCVDLIKVIFPDRLTEEVKRRKGG